MSENTEQFGYWGKLTSYGGEPYILWIGKMTRAEMLEHFPAHRHNFSPDAENSQPVFTNEMHGQITHPQGRVNN